MHSFNPTHMKLSLSPSCRQTTLPLSLFLFASPSLSFLISLSTVINGLEIRVRHGHTMGLRSVCDGVWWLLRLVCIGVWILAFRFRCLRLMAIEIGVLVLVLGIWWVSAIEIEDFWWVLGLWVTGFGFGFRGCQHLGRISGVGFSGG